MRDDSSGALVAHADPTRRWAGFLAAGGFAVVVGAFVQYFTQDWLWSVLTGGAFAFLGLIGLLGGGSGEASADPPHADTISASASRLGTDADPSSGSSGAAGGP